MGQKTGRPGNPKLDDETWVALLERYARGVTQAALGLDYGVSVSAVAWRARQRGYRKNDRPDAVYRWVQPPPMWRAGSTLIPTTWRGEAEAAVREPGLRAVFPGGRLAA